MHVQHVGIFWLIYNAQKSGIQITTQYLLAKTKLTRPSILSIMAGLEQIGLIKKTTIAASHGKGRMFEFSIDIPAELIQEITASFLKPKKSDL